jgi:FkbM family methyltransferase
MNLNKKKFQARSILLFNIYKFCKKNRSSLFGRILNKIGNFLAVDLNTGYAILNFKSFTKKKYFFPPVTFLNRDNYNWYIESPLNISNWVPLEYEAKYIHPSLNNLESGDTVLDIGANVGFFSILASDRVGNNGNVVAFEPIPETASILENTIRINKITNLTVERMALSEFYNDNSKMRYSYAGDAFAMLLDSNQHLDLVNPKLEKTSQINVPVTYLDKYVSEKKLKNIKLIKIDAEGSEIGILKSSLKTIHNYKPTFIVEFWNNELEQGKEFFKNLNYSLEIFTVNNKGMYMIIAKAKIF